MLDSSALVHMNGRAYNPIAGRFVSADPFFDCGLGTQGWNRYNYVGNRAMSATDPTGFFSWDYCDPNQGIYDIFQCFYGRFGGGFYLNVGPVIYVGEKTEEECNELKKVYCSRLPLLPTIQTIPRHKIIITDETYWGTWPLPAAYNGMEVGVTVDLGRGRSFPKIGLEPSLDLEWALFEVYSFMRSEAMRVQTITSYQIECKPIRGCPKVKQFDSEQEIQDTGWYVSQPEEHHWSGVKTTANYVLGL